MDNHTPSEQHSSVTAGQDFIRRIGPAGMALFLILAALVTWLCLTSGRDPIPGYEAPQTTEYYAGHPEELAAELETHVFPALPDYDMTAAVSGGSVTVTIDSEHFVVGRAALLRYFDGSLISFEEG